MFKFILGFAVCVTLTNGIAIEEPRTSDVLDLGAWLSTWFLAIGAYSGRQERPGRRDSFGTKEDLPNVYIPNELTGNEIERAFRLSGQKQAVTEVNELLDYLSFIGTKRSGPGEFVKLEDGHFKLTNELIDPVKKELERAKWNELEGKDDVTRVIVELMEQLKLKSKFSDWDDMSGEVNRIYQEAMTKLKDNNYLKVSEDGFYELSKSLTDMIKDLVEKEILVDERRWRLRDENDFQSVKEWEAFEERVNNMINSGSQIVKLPQELTWSGIKSALQAMYKKAISQIHVFQFLTKRLDYIEMDREAGFSKLSPLVTEMFTDSLYYMFRYMTPLRQW